MKLRRNNRLIRKCAPKVTFKDKKPKLSKSPRKRKVVKISLKKGYHRSSNITLKETALNNKILRIHLPRVDLNSLKSKFAKPNTTKIFTKPNNTTKFTRANNSKKLKKTALNLNKKNTLTSPNNLHKINKKQHFKVKLFPKKTCKVKSNSKMVVSNGKIFKHEADVLKRLKLKNSRVFYLKFANCKTATEGKLSYKFHQLVNDVKNMQLPTPSWKIKVIIRHNKIAAIIFTNKSEIERSVSFNSDEDKYHIVFDNKPAILLGSPGKVDNCHDIEVLLSILETIEKDSPMIVFK